MDFRVNQLKSILKQDKLKSSFSFIKNKTKILGSPQFY